MYCTAVIFIENLSFWDSIHYHFHVLNNLLLIVMATKAHPPSTPTLSQANPSSPPSLSNQRSLLPPMTSPLTRQRYTALRPRDATPPSAGVSVRSNAHRHYYYCHSHLPLHSRCNSPTEAIEAIRALNPEELGVERRATAVVQYQVCK